MWSCSASYTILICSECHVLSGLHFEAATSSVVCYCLCSKVLSCWKHDMGALSCYMRKCLQEHPPPAWQACKVLHQWELFRETMVYVYMYRMSYIHIYVPRADNMITTHAHLDAFIVKKVLQNFWNSVQISESFCTCSEHGCEYIQKSTETIAR